MPAERRLIRLVGSLPRKLKITASSEQNTAARVRGTKVLWPESDSMTKLSLPVCQYEWNCSPHQLSTTSCRS